MDIEASLSPSCPLADFGLPRFKTRKVSEIALFFFQSGDIAMLTLAKQILEHATGAPEGTPLVAKELLHLGSRAAVDQVLKII